MGEKRVVGKTLLAQVRGLHMHMLLYSIEVMISPYKETITAIDLTLDETKEILAMRS